MWENSIGRLYRTRDGSLVRIVSESELVIVESKYPVGSCWDFMEDGTTGMDGGQLDLMELVRPSNHAQSHLLVGRSQTDDSPNPTEAKP